MIVGFYRAVKTTTFVITQHEPSHRLLVYALDSVLPLSVVTNGTELLFLVGDLFFFFPSHCQLGSFASCRHEKQSTCDVTAASHQDACSSHT